MKITTNKKQIILIDKSDFKKVSARTWSIDSTGYPHISIKVKNKWTTIRLHRFLLDVPKGKEVDHINRNKLDNRRKNLRVCTKSENSLNHPLRKNNKTGHKGIWWDKKRNHYQIYKQINGEKTYLGIVKTIKRGVELLKKEKLTLNA